MQMECLILLILCFLRCLHRTPALAITKDASAEDKVRAQFVVAIAKISTGLTWAPPEDGRRGAAVRCVAIAASKVARAAIGAFSCGKLGIVCSVPSVQFNACSPYREWILMNLFLVKSGRFSEEDLAKLRNSSEEDLAKLRNSSQDGCGMKLYARWIFTTSWEQLCERDLQPGHATRGMAAAMPPDDRVSLTSQHLLTLLQIRFGMHSFVSLKCHLQR